jgi:GcrA cell cycle regulator
MPRVTGRSWTTEQINLLLTLVDRGVSPARASVVLKRPRLAVQHKARELGKPFLDSRQARAMRLAREAQARQAILATNRPYQALD